MRRILPALWLCFGSTVLFAEEGTPAKRLSVAVLGFENKTGDPELGHWRHALDVLLSEQLWKAKALRQKSGMAFAFRQLGFKSGSPLDAAQAKKMDEPLMEQERHARGAVLADPACPKAHAWLAAILGSQGNLVEAEVEARSALKIDANDAGSRLLMGHLLMEKGNSVEAEKEL